jgi:hypothetical protein
MSQVNSKTKFDWQFEPFPLKIGNVILKMKFVFGNSTQLLYWQIFECLDKIWRTSKFQIQERH